ncbi:hypothetical protein CRUP_014661 [Coryphaenoides rupestris]|nr:hypothetical protein CRUP_014661 [Coryphaenoides rupestris]
MFPTERGIINVFPCVTEARSRARTQGGRAAAAAAAADRSTPQRGWEPPVQLDGSPVDRYSVSATKPIRAQHRLAKAGGDADAGVPLLEDVDADWANLDGFAVVGGAPVNVSSAAGRAPRPLAPAAAPARVEPPVEVPVVVPAARVNRRPPQSSSGPRQAVQPGSRTTPSASESVHVVSLQAQRTPGHRSAPIHRAVVTKAIVPEPEEEAKDITVRVMSPQSVLISWVDPAVELQKVPADELRYYTVKYREKGESARWEYKEGTQRRLLVDSLSADGMYEFSVKITQGENHGKWSVSVFQRTPESAPSGPPENFEVKPLRGKGTAVVATWDPPEEPNGRIREYILSYAPAMKPFGMKSITYRSGTTSATIDGLTPGDRYIFKIKATNRRGQGPLSKVFSVAMPGTMPSSKSQHTSSKEDRGGDEDHLESAEVTEAPQTTPATNRRVRPLSQSRSYHSIFSSIRGSVRNGASSRGRAREEEEEEEETSPTTPPPEEEPVTVKEEEEPDNDVVYQEPEVTPTPQATTLQAVTLAPTTTTSATTRVWRRDQSVIKQAGGKSPMGQDLILARGMATCSGLCQKGLRSQWSCRQSGGYRLPFRVQPAKNTRASLSKTESSLSESTSSSSASKMPKPVLTSVGVVDLAQGLLLNEEGRALQDSQGRPRRVVLGEDGHTIFDLEGSPLVNQDGLALFGHGRDSRPVVNPKDKILTVGGKLVLGLDRPHHRTTTTATTTTTRAPTTTTTTTIAPTTTTEWYPEESTTFAPYPTCPPGTFSKTDEYGDPLLDPEGILDCYPDGFPSANDTTAAPHHHHSQHNHHHHTTTTQAPPTQPGPFNKNPRLRWTSRERSDSQRDLAKGNLLR